MESTILKNIFYFILIISLSVLSYADDESCTYDNCNINITNKSRVAIQDIKGEYDGVCNYDGFHTSSGLAKILPSGDMAMYSFSCDADSVKALPYKTIRLEAPIEDDCSAVVVIPIVYVDRFPYGDAVPLLGHPIKNTEGSSTYCKSEIKIKTNLLISHDHLLKYYITISRK
jgi:hypothetical protein